MATDDYTSKLHSRLWTSETRLAYALILPSILVLAVFIFYPIANVLVMAFFHTNRLSRLERFVGFRNFRQVFRDPTFWTVTGRSLLWTVFAVAVKTTFGMVIALLLNVRYMGSRIARLLFIIPWASAAPISAMLWKWVYHPEFGLLNHTLKASRIWLNPPIWLGYPIPAFLACIWVDSWIGIPFMALMFLAGMQAIPEDLYESSFLDGAGRFQNFIYITLPSIAPIILIATLLSVLWTFNDFNTIYILTKGGPVGTTDILITDIYKNAFDYLQLNRASTMAFVTFVILAILSFIYARVYFQRERSK
jgi:multiple sugar transport system permease protein